MSHFSCLVIGKNVKEQLQPYHEFECTGIIDQYVQDVDKTEEARKQFLESETRRYRSPNGELHDPYQDRFYRVATTDAEKAIKNPMGCGCGNGVSWSSKDWNDGKGYSARFHFVPDGWEEIEVPTKDIETFAEWAADYYGVKIWPHFDTIPDRDNEEYKYGYITIESTGELKSVIDRTNPDAHWDWWTVGGRYSDRLLLKNGTRGDVSVKEFIDFDGMIQAKKDEAGKLWDEAHAILADYPIHTAWPILRESLGVDAARKAYNKQPAILAWSKSTGDIRYEDTDDFLISREEYCNNAGLRALGAFAFVKDGKWAQKGDMGWWGMASNEMSDNEWYSWVAEQMKALSDDEMITMVDCHI